MTMEIGYLELVRGDLAEAGHRESSRRPRSGIRARYSGRALVGAAAAVTLLLAGTLGWLMTNGTISSDRTVAVDSGASTGATGAGGGDAPASDGGAGPQATPAPWQGYTGGSPGVGGDDGSIVDPSRVIRTAELGLQIPPDSFDGRFAQAVEIASAHGGFVANSTTRERSGNLTLRVPAASFDAALADLRELGDIEVQTLQGRDVTADYVDLQARLRIAKSRRSVLLRLMDRATSIEQTIRVQNALDDTQLRIEELQGQLGLLDDRVALATIAVSLREEGVEPEQDIETASIPNAFERSIAGFVGVIAAMVVGLGYLIPLLVVGLVAWFVVVRVRRRRRSAD